MYLSIVIPAYNEKENIPMIVGNVEMTLNRLSVVSGYEIIICDDHSSDGTFESVSVLMNSRVRAIRLSRRSGSHTAIRAGLREARGEIVLCISADGQDDPGILSQMIEKIKEGAHIVWGVRIARSEPILKKQVVLFFYQILGYLVQNSDKIDLANADFYLLHRKVVDAINSCKERNTSLFGLIAWIGFKQDQVSYERGKRKNGKSKWNFRSRMRLATDWIIAFSGLPLKLITLFGILFALAGFLYALAIIILYFLGKTTPGWAEMVILILLLGGIQMCMIGIIGQYLWRTLDESRYRPLYFVEEETPIHDKFS
jgi:dolichol-phosphate mannosyltransferase